MSDTLIYRLPGASVVEQSGQFGLLEAGQTPSGFVISDFLHQRIYLFTPGTTEQSTEWHVHSDVPVVISKRDYQIEAQAMLHAFPVMQVSKAVYSRVKQVTFPIGKAKDLFAELERTYPKAFVYLVSSSEFGTWVGATPETLISAHADEITTLALAGTHPIHEQSEWTHKEREEHDFVVQAIEEALVRNGCESIQKNGPYVVEAGPVQHLQTDFAAKAVNVPVWQIAMDLHPTPAVCGTPRMASLDLLYAREMHDRFLYTGIIGIVNENATRLFVNLRCAQMQHEKTYLYLGGGYTIDSIPDLEWEETENKGRTLLNCMEKTDY